MGVCKCSVMSWFKHDRIVTNKAAMFVRYLAPGVLEGMIALLENSDEWETRLTV